MNSLFLFCVPITFVAAYVYKCRPYINNPAKLIPVLYILSLFIELGFIYSLNQQTFLSPSFYPDTHNLFYEQNEIILTFMVIYCCSLLISILAVGLIKKRRKLALLNTNLAPEDPLIKSPYDSSRVQDQKPSHLTSVLVISAIISLYEACKSAVIADANPFTYIALGGYSNNTSGLSEYLAVPLAFSLVINEKIINRFQNYRYSRLQKLLLVIIISSGILNFLYGARSAASVIAIFGFIFLMSRTKSIKIFGFSITGFSLVMLIFIFLYSAASFVSLLRSNAFKLYSTISIIPLTTFTESLNTSVVTRYLQNADAHSITLDSIITKIYNIVLIGMPQGLLGMNAALNPALPYKEISASGFHVGGGGLFTVQLQYVFGYGLGSLLCILILTLLFLPFDLKLGSLNLRVVKYSLILLTVRLITYDPASVVLRTIPLGLLIVTMITLVCTKAKKLSL